MLENSFPVMLLSISKRFVFISSVAVYGKEEGNLIDENTPLSGDTPYAKSKINTEELLKSWTSENNIILTNLRLPLVVGESPPGNLGAMIRMLKRGLYLGIGSGATRKSMVLAEDVGHFIPVVAAIGGTYNLTDGHHPSMLELECAIAEKLHKSKPWRLPDLFIRIMAGAGDFLGDRFPVNSKQFAKLTSTLTFSDARARNMAGWSPHSVINHLPNLL